MHLLEAVENSDIVIINAGSSAGSKDYTVHIIEELGKVFTHGVATRPGKPVILGKINDKIGDWRARLSCFCLFSSLNGLSSP